MNPVFFAGRALGRAEMLRLANKNGASQVRTAADALRRAKVAELVPIATKLDGIASAWEARKAQVPPTIAEIQKLGGKTYHCVSAGVLLGQAIEGPLSADGLDLDLVEAKNNIVTWLAGAKGHVAALRLQGYVPTLRDFDADFDRLTAPIGQFERLSDLKAQASLTENVSNQVGNAIP